jgi:hypothetical protein
MHLALKKWLVPIGNSPVITGVAAVLSVLAGALASFFTNSIRTSLALPADPSRGNTIATTNFHWTGEATIFWLLVALTVILFGLSKFSDSEVDNAHKRTLNDRLHGLESMPPEAFLKILEREYTTAREAVAQATATYGQSGGTLPPSQIDQNIQTVLKAFATLAKAYDGHVDSTYRVYVLRLTRKDWPVEKLKRAVDLDNLPRQAQFGCLEAFAPLCFPTAASPVDRTELGPLTEFAVPVYDLDKSKHEKDFLPGAPRALLSERIYECESVPQLMSRLKAELHDEHQAVKLEQFFETGPGRSVMSFIALAIPTNKWAPQISLHWQGSQFCGALVVETDHEHLLRNANGFFYPVVRPLLFMLADLLAMRKDS